MPPLGGAWRPIIDTYLDITLPTNRGPVLCQFYGAPQATSGVAWIGEDTGDAPEHRLHPRLGQDLRARGISTLRLHCRVPTDPEESASDVLAGLMFLRQQGVGVVAVTGYSCGAEPAIRAAVADPIVRTVVTLAMPVDAIAQAGDLPNNCSILIVHDVTRGTRSELPAEDDPAWRHDPQRLALLEGARHAHADLADRVYLLVRNWIEDELLSANDQDAPAP